MNKILSKLCNLWYINGVMSCEMYFTCYMFYYFLNIVITVNWKCFDNSNEWVKNKLRERVAAMIVKVFDIILYTNLVQWKYIIL